MKVWIIERGDYSDRHIVAVLSSEEKAKAFEFAYDYSQKRHIFECVVPEGTKTMPCPEHGGEWEMWGV